MLVGFHFFQIYMMGGREGGTKTAICLMVHGLLNGSLPLLKTPKLVGQVRVRYTRLHQTLVLFKQLYVCGM
jgi:hypothetical protein